MTCRGPLGAAMNYDFEYLNSGVLVFDPVRHAQAIDMSRYISMLYPANRSWEVYDQGCLSLGIKLAGVPLHRLGADFNRCGAVTWDRWKPEMENYVWHFCGAKNPSRIDQTNWRVGCA